MCLTGLLIVLQGGEQAVDHPAELVAVLGGVQAFGDGAQAVAVVGQAAAVAVLAHGFSNRPK